MANFKTHITVVSALLAFAVMFGGGMQLSILEMLLLWAVVWHPLRTRS